ncbi:hypothetical protein ACF061_28160 [Streptomyces sp. NPDC015220]|uniref:hypothetical protein n=1 Tax=Streptomyces sp. NPDC015220 TaxID=3364947 RepID=UPI0036FDC86F
MLDEVSAAVGKVSRTRACERMYGAPSELDAGALVWSAARSRGRSQAEAADLAQAAAAAELAGARVVDVTRLPTPPRTAGSAHASPAAWADAELAVWWPQAVRALCARLEKTRRPVPGPPGQRGQTPVPLPRLWPRRPVTRLVMVSQGYTVGFDGAAAAAWAADAAARCGTAVSSATSAERRPSPTCTRTMCWRAACRSWSIIRVVRIIKRLRHDPKRRRRRTVGQEFHLMQFRMRHGQLVTM